MASKINIKSNAISEIQNILSDIIKNELYKETVCYIKSNHKYELESDEEVLEKDKEPEFKDLGPYKIKDYVYFRDFKCTESNKGYYEKFDDDYWDEDYFEEWDKDYLKEYNEEIYNYVPVTAEENICGKISRNLKNRKNEIITKIEEDLCREEVFKNNIELPEDTDFEEKEAAQVVKKEIKKIFEKEYKKISKGSVYSGIDDKLLADVYKKGCQLLNIPNDSGVFEVKACKSEDEKEFIKFIFSIFAVPEPYEKVNNLKTFKNKRNSLKNLNNLLEKEIYNIPKHMEKFISDARDLVKKYYFTIYKFYSEKEIPEAILYAKNDVEKLLEKMAVVENILYQEYRKIHQYVPKVSEFKNIKINIHHIMKKNMCWYIENVYIKERKKIEVQNKILTAGPVEEYDEALKMKRHFYLHTGQTNTGKTYNAIQKLMQAESGVYLAPLRLLALEIQDKLNSEGVLCSLLTGEEEDIVPHAEHISSTVEKLNTEVHYEVCVIDEAQMISDSERGWAWTRAIMGVLAEEIHICMAPEALEIVREIIKECNDTYEIIEHTRDTELVFENKVFNFNKDVKEGDALVVFSKKKVLDISAKLLNKNIKTSIIYGSLPYSTRKKQFERFLNGETKVLVTTDAIGMGVNLPIKRIVFLETEKFDGKTRRKLNVSEIKQIAGRAGRKGIYDKGYVASSCDKNLIKSALTASPNAIKKCYVGVPESLLKVDADLINTLKTWNAMPLGGIFKKTDITRTIDLLNKIKNMEIEVSKEDAYKMASIPFAENDDKVNSLWIEYCIMYCKGAVNLRKPQAPKKNSPNELEELEKYYRMLDLNYSFGRNFSMIIDKKYLTHEKEQTANKINNILVTRLLDHERKCSRCGKKLPWDYQYSICSKCYYSYDSRYYRW